MIHNEGIQYRINNKVESFRQLFITLKRSHFLYLHIYYFNRLCCLSYFKQIVNDEFYKTELNNLGFDIELGHFLIPQEHVENVAMQTPKERTVLFEKLSGSIAFKADYDKYIILSDK